MSSPPQIPRLRRLLLVGSYMIDDIGLPPKQAIEDAQRPFWQA